MTIVLVVLYVIVCLFLIAVVLLQTGKRADLAGAFGGGGSQTAFGTRGAANLLTRLTTVSAIAFMVIALTLSIIYRGGGEEGTVLDEVEPAPSSEAAPVAPVGSEPPPSEAEAATPGAESTVETPADPVPLPENGNP
jgi:preprotein translocase subunit SecG